jgi:4-hydroxy-tetrahydrodipicolinate synthase
MPRTPYEPKGVIPACLMPFDADLAIDEPSYRAHLADLAAVDGITAITINGHAAEVHALSLDEQQRAAAVTADALGDRLPFIVGVYSDGSANAAAIARMAEREGASALLVFPPNSLAMGGHLRPEMALGHFEAIAAATDLPIILFQYPMASNLGYTLDALLQILHRVPTIRAIKDWCNDPALHERHVRELHALSRPVNVLTTHSAWLMPSLTLGCDGLLSGAGSVIANLQVALFRAVEANDLAEARRVADRIYPCTRAFYGQPFLDMHNRMKEALVYLGRLPAAHVRPPLRKLPAAEVAAIGRYMDQAGLTPQSVYAKVA